MKKRKLFIKIASALLCVSLLISAVPAFALDVESNQDEVLELDTSILVKEKSYSFIFQYDEIGNKSELIDAIEESGGTIGFEIDYMNSVSAMLTMDQLAIIKEMECVLYVERDYDYNLLTENEEPADELDDEAMRQLLAGEPPVLDNPELESDDLNAADKTKPGSDSKLPVNTDEHEPYDPFAYAHERDIKGQNIKIALFDTGIADHPDYTVSGGVSFAGDMLSYTDTDGHGTKMAGIIAAAGVTNPNVRGAAPQAELYAVRLVETEGESFITTAAILMGIGWSIDNGMDIINLSFGTYFESKFLQDAINLAYANNILLVSAVGNDGGFEDEYRIMYPAAYENVIAVGAGDASGTAPFSNNNAKLDFVAPGGQQSTMLNGAYANVVGTSVSAAYVTGILAGLWSHNTIAGNEVVLNIAKSAAVVSDPQIRYVGFGEISLENGLQNFKSYAILKPIEKASKNSDTALETVTALELAAREQFDEEMPPEMTRGNCFVNEMASAISIAFDAWKIGKINCPGNEVWYKFTSNSSHHTSGGYAHYTIKTLGGSFGSGALNDTVLYLYDSSGNQLGYNDDYFGSLQSLITLSLPYNNTYYVRVKGYGSNTGEFMLYVKPDKKDDHGNTISTATSIIAAYQTNKTQSGYIAQGDVDMFVFVPLRDCYMEWYTEGSTDTYGTMYNECGTPIISNDDGNGNGNFKINYHLEGMKFYYIKVEHYSHNATGNYTLKNKFVKDWKDKSSYSGSPLTYYTWTSDTPYGWIYDGNGDLGRIYDKVYVPQPTAGNYKLRVIDGGLSSTTLATAIQNQNYNDIVSIVGIIVGHIPGTDILLDALSVGQIIAGRLNKNLSYVSENVEMNNYIGNHPGTLYSCFIEGQSRVGVVAETGQEYLYNDNYHFEVGSNLYGATYVRGKMLEIRWTY